MTVKMARIDQKLIHGQVTMSWVPYLSINTIIVADEELLDDEFTQKIMTSGLPVQVTKLYFSSPDQVPDLVKSPEFQRRNLLILFRNIEGVKKAMNLGLTLELVNLGNQVYPPPIKAIKLTECFSASRDDISTLESWAADGLRLIFQSVPGAKSIPFSPNMHKWPE